MGVGVVVVVSVSVSVLVVVGGGEGAGFVCVSDPGGVETAVSVGGVWSERGT